MPSGMNHDGMKRLFSLLTALAMLAVAPALASGQPLDFSPAPVAAETGYISAYEYQDDTLHVWIEDIERDDSVYHVAHVEIADASQLRTALSCKPGEKTKAAASVIGNAYHAVVGINGDGYLFRTSGYIVRQGQVLRKSTAVELDYLIIDTAGDFHALRKPTKKSLSAALKQYDVAQCFYFGPVLVLDGEAQTVYNQYGFAPQDRSPRTALGQVGELSYVLVVADGRQEQSRGVTHKQLAQFMADLGCQVAYNLDGGGSSTLLFHGGVYNSLSEGSEREISDILYFATGLGGE
jgi:exopolysaccharide biosynthesis protein